MCGITGKFYFGALDRVVDPAVVTAMTNIVSYRGPDDSGYYIQGPIGLGHRRLSILDLSSAGHQPMCNEDGSVWVVFNGEIYNYKGLRHALEGRGHIFRSNTDTEVIVHAYEEYGDDCVRLFSGMFAFGIWDERRRRLLLARDHFGIKPVYYFENSEFISFASEVKSLLEDDEVPRAVDHQALANFLTLHYVPAPRTMFKHIQKLLPGHILIAERGRCRTEKFWELKKNQPSTLSEAEMADYVYTELRESVRQRLQSDVPVGTLLSGGLDSSAVLGLMTELTDKPVPAFSVGYSADGKDGVSEFAYSRLAARHFSSDYHEVVVTSKMFMDFLPQAIWHQDEPIGEPAAIPLYYTCKLAKDHGVTVLLSGEGSDELFAGYNRYIGEAASRYYGMLPAPIHTILKRILEVSPKLPLLKKGHRAMAVRDWRDRYQLWHTVFSHDMKAELLSPAGEFASDSFSDAYDRYLPLINSLDNVDRLLWLDLKVWLPDDLLVKKDKMGMAASLEARVPFLDDRFAELMFNIPSEMKVRRLSGKHILKKSMERLLPKEIIYRKKAGFPTPIGRWIASELRAPLSDILNNPSADHGFFDRGVVRRLFDEHVGGRVNHERLLFPLINFDLWYSAFMRAPSRRVPLIASTGAHQIGVRHQSAPSSC